MDIIEKLWYDHLSNEELEMTDEQKELSKRLCESDEALRSRLSKDEITELDLCNSYLSDIYDITVKRAFVSGVSFTVNFLFEALGRK